MTDGETYRLEAYKVAAVDTSGAGDAFIGCFAGCYVRHGDVRAAMQTASAFAALSVTAKGTQMSYPAKDAVETFIASHAPLSFDTRS